MGFLELDQEHDALQQCKKGLVAFLDFDTSHTA